MSRLAKLRAMPVREIEARARYAAYLVRERRLHRRGLLAPPNRLRAALREDVRAREDWADRLTSREETGAFFAGASPVQDREVFIGRYADELVKARRIADDILENEIEFFGERFRYPGRIDWHADPVTGAQWPRTFHADVPVHGGDRGFGDVKYVWELNRHQFLMDLAKVALIDGSEPHRRKLQELVDSFLADVPYATGAAWACPLEPAFRAWSWLWAYHLARAAAPLETSFHLAWLTGFYDHGRFLYRHLETYASPYNHLIGEASALFALGLLFPEFTESTAWVARGQHVLESTVDSQFHDDGGTVEQSTFYHHATLGFYLLAAILGSRNNRELSSAVRHAIERGVDFSMSLIQPDGRVPRIGGADDGKPIRLEHLPFFDFRPYQAIGAVLFSRPDFRHAAGRFWEDAYWLLGPDGATAFDAMQPKAPALARALSSAGYYVVRSSWEADADYLCVDCGPQAAGLRRDDVPSAAHGHADCLSVVVLLGGREVLVDPGFFCYNGPPAWEVHFRRTLGHNTVAVDGRDQAQHISKMAWTRTYTATVEGWSPDGDLGWIRGRHDGYARLDLPVTHRRTAWLRPDGYLILFDEITGRGEHVVDVNFQFAPGELDVRATEGRAVFDGRYVLGWTADVPLAAATAHGGEAPSDGWIAPSLGIRQPAPRLRLTAPLRSGRVMLLTILADMTRASLAPVTIDGERLSAVLTGRGGWVDAVTGAADGTLTATREPAR